MLPTPGVFDFHGNTGPLVGILGLETASFVFLFCSRKKKTRFTTKGNMSKIKTRNMF